MVVAILLRVYEVFRFPFEQDELYTIDEATNLFHTRLLPGIQARPFFFLLEHPFLALTDPTAPYLRLLPLIFGVAGVWVTWRLARDLAGPVAGFFALVLVTISPWHLYASGFARYYSLLFLLAGLVYWLLPGACDTDRPRRYVAVLIPLFLGTWTHPSFVFPIIGVALAISIFRSDGGRGGFQWPSRNAWTWLWGPFLALSAITAVAMELLHHSTNVANGGDRGLLATLRLVPAMVDWMTVLVAIASVAGVVLLVRSGGRYRQFGWMAVFGCVFTLIALFGLSFRTAIYADYGIAALPLVLVAAAFPVGWLAEHLPVNLAASGANAFASILVVGILPSTVSHLSDGTRFDYRPALKQIEATDAGIEVLAWPIAIQRAYAPALQSRELPTSAARLDSALTQYHDLWAVVSVKRYGIVGDDTGGMALWLRKNCRQKGEYQRPRLDYRIYRVDLWRCTLGE
jgi:hypothetical protein